MAIQFDFGGKRVLVTDSATGLGRKIAQAFHQLGATVAINDASEAVVGRTVREMGGGPRLVAAAGDVTQTAEIRGIVQRAIIELTQLDVLVCGTARGSTSRVEEITAGYWEDVLNINLKAAFFTAQACVPALRVTRGCIVNVASVLGIVGGIPGVVAYATAKGAMVQMSRMMALELAREGIRVNTVCPGWAETAGSANGGTLESYFAVRAPLGRTATPEECAAAVLYLAAPFASYTTGAILIADGGLSAGHYLA